MNYRNRQKPSYSMMLALEPRMVFDGAVAVPDTAAIVADAAHVTGNVLSDGTPHDSGTGTLNVQGVASGSTTVPLNTGVNTTVKGLYGSLDIQANGSYDYSLNTSAANVMALGAGQPATDTFSYTMTDAAHNTSTTTLTIDITGVNHAPSAVADSTHITASAANVTGNLLTNDTDPDPDAGDTKTVSAIATANTAGNVGSALSGTYGSLTVNADGSYSYALDHNNAATLALPVGQTLTETFNYTTKDSGDLSSSSTLTITIDGSNTANTVGSYSVVRDVSKATEVVFLDGALPNLNLLESSVPTGIEIVVLDPTGNEVQQITNFLADHKGYSAVNIVSHGDSGELFLGQSVLSNATLAQYSQQLEVWKNSLAPGADLLIYGCDVASGNIGQNFINELAQLTGTTVAASSDTTGSATYGGNWILEAQTGVLDVKTIDFGTTGWDGEMASAPFKAVYQGTPSAWSVQAQNLTLTSQLNATAGSINFISTNPSDPLFSGNNVAGTLYYKDNTSGNEIAISGVISRQDKTGSTTNAFFFYAPGADGLVNGVGDTAYILQLNGNSTVYTIGNSVSTSSDPVTTALNTYAASQITTTTLPTLTAATSSSSGAQVAIEAGGASNGTVGQDGTGNVLTASTGTGLSVISVGLNATSQAAVAASSTSTTSYTSVTGSFGTLRLGANGTYDYVVNNSNASVQALRLSSDTLSDSFTYIAKDSNGNFTSTTLTVTIDGKNDAPTAINDYNTVTACNRQNSNRQCAEQ